MTVGERIKRRRVELGMSAEQLAGILGINKATIFRYENGVIEKMPITILEPIAEALKTTPAWLLGWYAEDTDRATETIPIKPRKFKLLGAIACGEPILATQDIDLYVSVGTDIQADFCLRAKGDSMIGARIYDGDIVFIRQQPTVENGEIAAVAIGDEATLKRVYYDKTANVLLLQSENPMYKPLCYTGAELEQIRIMGKAVAFQSDVR